MRMITMNGRRAVSNVSNSWTDVDHPFPSVGPPSQKRPTVWTGPGLPKRAILKPQAPTWRLDYYTIIEFLNMLSLIRTDVSQSGLAAARIRLLDILIKWFG